LKNNSLSIIIITLNEQRNIARCLQSIRFCPRAFSKRDILVVDAGSRDKTVNIARKLGARVFVRPWKGYSEQKNWALERVKSDWILSLDADEELTAELISEIERKVLETPPDVTGYFIKRRAFFLGKWIRHCGWWPDAQLRLVKAGTARFTEEPVHEGLETAGRTLEFDSPMNHFTYDSIRQYLEKMNKYSDLALQNLKPKKIRFWWFYMTVAPLLTFFRMYVSRQGFKDGWHGLVVCGLSAFHDFCKYAKMWEKEILKR
jgi:glycosyltransferase involved in cell wall biosynthesis